MAKRRGRRPSVNHEKLVRYARLNPSLRQADIGVHFGLSQKQVSRIMRRAGIEGVKRAPYIRKQGQTDEQFVWEKCLHDANLGMERGLRINNQRIYYAEDPRKEEIGDHSATSDAA